MTSEPLTDDEQYVLDLARDGHTFPHRAKQTTAAAALTCQCAIDEAGDDPVVLFVFAGAEAAPDADFARLAASMYQGTFGYRDAASIHWLEYHPAGAGAEQLSRLQLTWDGSTRAFSVTGREVLTVPAR